MTPALSAQPAADAARATRWRRDQDALAFNVVRKRLAHRPPTMKGAHRLRFRGRLLGRQLIFGCRCFQLFECQRQLLDQPRRTFRPLPIDLML